MKEEWIQQMQQKLADFRMPAPEVSWDEIEKALAKNRQKAKTLKMWTYRTAAAVVMLIVVIAGYLAFNQGEVPENKKVEAVADYQNTVPQQTKEITVNIETVCPKPQSQIITIPSFELCSYVSQEQEEENERLVNVSQTESSVLCQKEKSPTSQTQNAPTSKTCDSSKIQAFGYHTEIHKQKNSGNRLKVKVYMSNCMTSSNYSTSEYLGYTTSERKEMKPQWFEGTTEPEYDIYYIYKHIINEEEIHHRLPVRFGLCLRYRLNNRWSVESGFVYTRLKSDFTLKENEASIETKQVLPYVEIPDYANYEMSSICCMEQTLSYIGIPVNVSYLLWGSRYVGFYVSAGGMAEKMVNGSLRYETSSQKQDKTESVSIRPLQFSINGAIGAEFNLSRQSSIYAEPGIGYYFDNGSSVPTYYQDKPFTFNLNIGLKFNIR